MRAWQTFFQYYNLWSALYILGTCKILIFFKFIAVDAFEYWIFSWKSKKNIENFQKFQIFKIYGKNRIFKKKFKLQIALKNSLFELWPNKKICNEILSWRLHFQKNFWRARTSARGARRISHRCENSKIMVFWYTGLLNKTPPSSTKKSPLSRGGVI